jgi:hypothetical protein
MDETDGNLLPAPCLQYIAYITCEWGYWSVCSVRIIAAMLTRQEVMRIGI